MQISYSEFLHLSKCFTFHHGICAGCGKTGSHLHMGFHLLPRLMTLNDIEWQKYSKAIILQMVLPTARMSAHL